MTNHPAAGCTIEILGITRARASSLILSGVVGELRAPHGEVPTWSIVVAEEDAIAASDICEMLGQRYFLFDADPPPPAYLGNAKPDSPMGIAIENMIDSLRQHLAGAIFDGWVAKLREWNGGEEPCQHVVARMQLQVEAAAMQHLYPQAAAALEAAFDADTLTAEIPEEKCNELGVAFHENHVNPLLIDEWHKLNGSDR